MTITINPQSDCTIAVFEGRLDTVAATQANIDMQPLFEHVDMNIILDCYKLEFISSSGLRLFLSLRKATMAKQTQVIIRGASADIRQVFTITGFSTLFQFED